MIKDKKKIILGKLFKKYKEEQNITTVDIEYTNLSSTNTFYNACRGNIIKNDQFYIDYCKFFNHEYKEDITFDSWLENYIPRMIHSFDYYEENNFNDLYHEFNAQFKYKDYAIYHEYYQVIQSLFKYYIKNEYLRLEEVEDYLNLIDIDLLPKELSLYLLDYMFRSNWNYINKRELYDVIVNKMNSIDESHYVSMYQTGFLHKSNCKFVKALDLFQSCYEKVKLQCNKYREVQSLLAIYAIYRNIDDSLALDAANKLVEYKTISTLPNSLKHNINYNVGMQDYLEGRYERAYELFNENLIKYHSYFTLLFQCSICSRLGLEYPKELFLKEIEGRYDFIYLDYFRMKHSQVDNIKLAKYVLKTIIPQKLKAEIYRNPYWSLFEYEMKDLAKKDKKINKYCLEYIDFLAKNCKNS